MSYTGFVQGSETTLQSTYSDTSAQPTCDYGYGTWNSGANRGYENYGYGYGYGQENTSNYGYGMATSNSWEMPSSDANANPSAAGSTSADSVLSKINQRLDMVSHMEADMMQGGMYSSGAERYDSYEACNSRAMLSERDLYRSGYDYGELDPEMEMAYEGQYDAYRDQFRMRGGDAFGPRAQGWAREARGGRPVASGYGRMWEEPVGARGQCMPGAPRLPSLFSQNILPEYSVFQGVRGGGAFPGGSRFGFGFGNGMKQMRRTWKTWTPADFRTKKKKRKQLGSPDEPDSKASRTDGSDNSDSDNDEGTEGEATEAADGSEAVEKSSRVEGEDEEGKEDGKDDGKEDSGALTAQDESGQAKRKLQAGKKSQDKQKKRQRDRMVERIQFVCSLCKYRTFYEDEMASHLDSKFHKEHFKFVGTKLPKQTADFLQEYVANKTKKTEELRKTVEDLDGLIQQIYRDQDLTQEIAMEHFVRKVEAAHCAACDLFIPMQFGVIQKHLKTMDHNRNRRLMMEQSKKSSLMVARSILNNKLISKKLERYLKVKPPGPSLGGRAVSSPFPALFSPGQALRASSTHSPGPGPPPCLTAAALPQGENPFTDSPEEDKDPEEGEASVPDEGVLGEAPAAEGPSQPPVPPEPEAAAPPPPPPEEEEEAVPLLGGALQRQIRGIPGLDVEADDDEEGGGGAP